MPIKFLNSGLLEGSLQLTSYGGGSISGTGTYNLGVDASGNVIETSLIEGSGTTNYVVKWTPDGSTLGNSQIFDNGTNVGVGTNQPDYKLDVDGQIRSTSSSFPVYFLQRETSITGDGTFTSTNGIASGFHLRTNSSGTIQDGFGGGIVFSLTDSGTASNTAARIYARRDGSDTTGALQFWGGLDGTTILSTMRADGSVYFDEYGSGTFTGTAVKNLSITSSGKIIETDAVPANVVETVTTTDGTYINLTPNSPTDGAVTVTADLSAVDGTSGANERYLTKTNKWAEISTIPGTYTWSVDGDLGTPYTVNSGNTVDFAGSTYITTSTLSGPTLVITHDNTARNDTTSSDSPGVGGTFTAVDSVTTNTTGHVTGLNLKTVTLPDDGIDGSGTLNYVAKFTPDGDTIGNSQIFDNGTNVGIGTSSPTSKIHIIGSPVATSGALITARNSDATSSNTTFGGIMFNSSPGTDYSIGKSNVNSATTLSFRNANTGASYMDIDSSGNVGIGTTSPSGGKLHIYATNTPTKFESSGLTLYNTYTNSNGNFGFVGSGNGVASGGNANDFGIQAVNNFVFATGGSTERMRIDSSGNLGLGTSSPINGGSAANWITVDGTSGNAYSGGVIYSIGGTSKAYHYVQDNYLLHQGQSGVGHKFLTGGTTELMRLNANGESSVFNDFIIDNASPEMYFKTGGTHYRWMVAAQENVDAALEITPSTTTGGSTYSTPVAVFKATGNVGIGTSSPSFPLHVVTDSGTYEVVTIQNGSSAALFRAIGSGGGSVDFGAEVGTADTAIIRTGSTERMRIDSSGQVGINTPVPEAKLGVFGGPLGSTSGNSVTHAQIRGDRHRLDFKEVRTANGSDWNNTTYKLQMRVDSTNHQSIDFVSDSSYAEHIDIYTGNQQFNTRFSANGNVGIGTSSPSQKLDVVGSIEVSDGIYLGGTASANKLDDYEEGTWTLSFGYGYQGGVTSYSVTSFTGYTWTGRYVKIGRLVHCTFFFGCNGFPWPINTSSTVFMLESSLPFAMDSTTKAVNGSYYNFPGFSSSATSVAEVTGVIYPGGYASYSGPGFVADRGFYQNFEGPDTDAFNLGPSTPSFQMKGSFEYYTAS